MYHDPLSPALGLHPAQSFCACAEVWGFQMQTESNGLCHLMKESWAFRKNSTGKGAGGYLDYSSSLWSVLEGHVEGGGMGSGKDLLFW